MRQDRAMLAGMQYVSMLICIVEPVRMMMVEGKSRKITRFQTRQLTFPFIDSV